LISVFSPPQLRIDFGLQSGERRSYRVVSEMMESGFLLSPLVRDTGRFAALFLRSNGLGDGDEVRTIAIAPSYGGTMFWSKSYTLTLKEYDAK
jgi:hypothetical protein